MVGSVQDNAPAKSVIQQAKARQGFRLWGYKNRLRRHQAGTIESMRDFAVLALWTSARRGDLLAARWEDISLDDNRWQIPNPKNRRPYVDLRRTLPSIVAAESVSLQIIGKSPGHSSTSATQVYARLTLDPVRRAIESARAVIMAGSKEKRPKLLLRGQ
jgi:hypothetical protein